MPKPKLIETPQDLWALFIEYRTEVKSNPRTIADYVGKEGNRVDKPLERPLTIEGFKNYCAEHVGDIQAYLFNRDDAYSQYSTIVTRIRDEIRQDQLEGGMVGQYNQNLTARINGLVDKQETKHEGEIKVTLDLSNNDS